MGKGVIAAVAPCFATQLLSVHAQSDVSKEVFWRDLIPQ